MSTIEGLQWAFGLEMIEPTSKLLAIYIGGRVGMDRHFVIDADEAAKFMGFRTTQIKRLQPCNSEHVTRLAIQGIPNIRFEQTNDKEFVIDMRSIFGEDFGR